MLNIESPPGVQRERTPQSQRHTRNGSRKRKDVPSELGDLATEPRAAEKALLGRNSGVGERRDSVLPLWVEGHSASHIISLKSGCGEGPHASQLQGVLGAALPTQPDTSLGGQPALW